MKKYFFTGLITLLPIVLTIMVGVYLVNLFTNPFVGVVKNLISSYAEKGETAIAQYEGLIIFSSRAIILILLVLTLVLLGFLARRFFFSSFLSMMNKIFLKIPFVKSIYSLSREITHLVFSESSKPFKKTVLAPFPRAETHALGFITEKVPPAFKELIPNLDSSVFIPTSPHPISGFLIMYPEKEIKEVNVTVEETFKFLISCGIIYPKKNGETPQPEPTPKPEL